MTEEENNEPPPPPDQSDDDRWDPNESEGDDDYYEEDDPNLEDTAWEIFMAEARLRAKDDKNTWPPLFVPQTRTELLSILLRPHSPEMMEFIRERLCAPPSQQPVQTDADHP